MPPHIKKNKEEPKVISVSKDFLKGLPILKDTIKSKRIRIEVPREATLKVKEIRCKAFKYEIEEDQKKKVKQSLSRMNKMTGIFNNTLDLIK